jgi:hypothetical protein
MYIHYDTNDITSMIFLTIKEQSVLPQARHCRLILGCTTLGRTAGNDLDVINLRAPTKKRPLSDT